jgi:hypothetical protein
VGDSIVNRGGHFRDNRRTARKRVIRVGAFGAPRTGRVKRVVPAEIVAHSTGKISVLVTNRIVSR